MEESLFIQWVAKNFKGLTIRAVETLNGENPAKKPLSYLHRDLLKKDYSVTGKWESISQANTLVMADVVAMDSSLPLKKRDSISRASGDIPKMGMEMQLNETQLTELDTLVRSGAADSVILAKLFADTPKVIGGIWERNEKMFLEGLSSGVTVVEDADNIGTGVRLDYGYLAANKFESATAWTNAAATPFADIIPLLDKASLDGNSPNKAYADRATLNAILKSDEAKEMYAISTNFYGANYPQPTLSQLNAATQDRYGFVFEMVDRAVQWEKNGVRTPVKPWKAGSVVFVNSDSLGSLIYATLAEENHPVAGVTYNKVDDFILVSKYRKNTPSLAEFTRSQARVFPVINNVDAIYLLDSTVTQA